jgi:hypothetical protein
VVQGVGPEFKLQYCKTKQSKIKKQTTGDPKSSVEATGVQIHHTVGCEEMTVFVIDMFSESSFFLCPLKVFVFLSFQLWNLSCISNSKWLTAAPPVFILLLIYFFFLLLMAVLIYFVFKQAIDGLIATNIVK